MKKNIISLTALAGGFILGASALVAVAQTGTWVSPTGAPPTNNTPAPINVGLNSQSKLGQLFVNTDITNPYTVGLSVFGQAIFNNTIKIPTGSGLHKVLWDADGSGTAQWVATSTLGFGGSSSGGTTGVSSIIPGTNVTISSTGANGTGNVTINSKKPTITVTVTPDNSAGQLNGSYFVKCPAGEVVIQVGALVGINGQDVPALKCGIISITVN